MLGSKVKRMIGRSEPVPSVDDGAIVAALHIVWALRGRAATRVWAVCRILGFSPRSNVVLAGGSGMQRHQATVLEPERRGGPERHSLLLSKLRSLQAEYTHGLLRTDAMLHTPHSSQTPCPSPHTSLHPSPSLCPRPTLLPSPSPLGTCVRGHSHTLVYRAVVQRVPHYTCMQFSSVCHACFARRTTSCLLNSSRSFGNTVVLSSATNTFILTCM